MQKRFLVVPSLLALVSLAGCTLFPTASAPNEPVESAAPVPTSSPEPEDLPEVTIAPAPTEFQTEVKSPHYVSSTPKHASTVEDVPSTVSLRFNFDVVPPSEMTVALNGKAYSTGEVQYDADQLGMSIAMAPNAPLGVYTVTYLACWPDTSCHEGSFQFQAGLSL